MRTASALVLRGLGLLALGYHTYRALELALDEDDPGLGVVAFALGAVLCLLLWAIAGFLARRLN